MPLLFSSPVWTTSVLLQTPWAPEMFRKIFMSYYCTLLGPLCHHRDCHSLSPCNCLSPGSIWSGKRGFLPYVSRYKLSCFAFISWFGIILQLLILTTLTIIRRTTELLKHFETETDQDFLPGCCEQQQWKRGWRHRQFNWKDYYTFTFAFALTDTFKYKFILSMVHP